MSQYKGVPLLEPFSSGPDLLTHLNNGYAAAEPAAAAAGPLPLIESPNCADAVELRGRWDAEVVALACHEPSAAVRKALAAYSSATLAVTRAMAKVQPAERVSGMNQPPRISRYAAMRQLYEALYCEKGCEGLPCDEALSFSCVNLSYDYDDDCDECSLSELDLTARIVLATCHHCFDGALLSNALNELKA